VLIVTGPDASAIAPATGAAAAVEVASVPRAGEGLDLESVLRLLAKREVNELLVESGPRLAGAFLAARLVDELVLYVAPHLLGDGALPLARLGPFATMAERPEFAFADVRRVGDDLRLTLLPKYTGVR
jgi:diaminohydroxyphosphoribosylaminopyrimidine deaminase/5-amino-6-(5-phosphoribosylamino)uracil reductase